MVGDTELDGLLRGCVEARADPVPRLLLADWLDDQGQPARAELVRVQDRLTNWVHGWKERQALLARQDALLAAHREDWLGPLDRLCQRVEFERGLCRLTATGAAFQSKAFGEALATAREALVGEVRLTECGDLDQVASRPWLGLVPALALAGLRPGRRALTPLMDSPHAGRLIDLDLSNLRLPPEAFAKLAGSPFPGRLVRLAVRNNRLGAAHCAALLDAAPGLHEIDAAGNRLTPGLIARLAPLLPLDRVMNSLGMEFVRVPSGSFLMGAADGERGALHDEYPRRVVELTRPFWLGRFAVTREQSRTVAGVAPAFASGATLPVGSVNFSNAEEFCHRLGELPAEKAARRSYRLPTEAEWEHACRGGTFTPFHHGDLPEPALVNCQPGYDDWAFDYDGRPAAVGSYPPNGFGLHEMHGNVWEWCADWYDADGYARGDEVDPVGPLTGTIRIARGGCWVATGASCRSARRGTASPADRHSGNGFRVVLVTAEGN